MRVYYDLNMADAQTIKLNTALSAEAPTGSHLGRKSLENDMNWKLPKSGRENLQNIAQPEPSSGEGESHGSPPQPARKKADESHTDGRGLGKDADGEESHGSISNPFRR